MTDDRALPNGPFPSPLVATAIGMKQSTVGTYADRGVFDSFDHKGGGRGRVRMLTMQDALALALIWEMSRRGLNIDELPPEAAHRWAALWVRTRGAANAIRELVVRYYGPNDVVSILPNEDAISNGVPSTGARVTIRFDLDAIFGPLIETLREAA